MIINFEALTTFFFNLSSVCSLSFSFFYFPISLLRLRFPFFLLRFSYVWLMIVTFEAHSLLPCLSFTSVLIFLHPLIFLLSHPNLSTYLSLLYFPFLICLLLLSCSYMKYFTFYCLSTLRFTFLFLLSSLFFMLPLLTRLLEHIHRFLSLSFLLPLLCFPFSLSTSPFPCPLPVLIVYFPFFLSTSRFPCLLTIFFVHFPF